jgi:hypothetical protein
MNIAAAVKKLFHRADNANPSSLVKFREKSAIVFAESSSKDGTVHAVHFGTTGAGKGCVESTKPLVVNVETGFIEKLISDVERN